MPLTKRMSRWISKLLIVLVATWCVGVSSSNIVLMRLDGKVKTDALILEKRITAVYGSLPRRVELIEAQHTKILALLQQVAQDVAFLKGQALAK